MNVDNHNAGLLIGHGIDLMPVERIQRAIDAHGSRFLERVFTPGELAYNASHARRAEHLTSRFAAKEAVLKALGTGWSGGIAWTDVEVVASGGPPVVKLHNEAARIAAERGITRWSLSLSHAAGFAIASAIAH